MEAMGGEPFDFPTASLEMNVLFVRCVEEVSYQRWVAVMLGTWQHDGIARAVPELAFSCLDEDWEQLWLVVKNRYWARMHHIETRLRMGHNLLVGWHNVEIFSIMPVDRGGMYPILPCW